MKRAKSHKYNAAGQEWKDLICRLGCIVCWREFHFYSPCVPHHRLINGRACQDTEAIPLCAGHHQTGGYGVAFHATGRKTWEEKYGTEADLFEDTQRRVGWMVAAAEKHLCLT